MNISATAVIGLFLLSSLFLLFKSGAKDWQDGEYLYFTWSLGNTKVHRTFAYILVGYTVLAVGAIVVMAYMHNGADDLFLAPEQLIKLTWSDAFSLVFAAGAFLSTHDPAFHWSDPRLRKAALVSGGPFGKRPRAVEIARPRSEKSLSSLSSLVGTMRKPPARASAAGRVANVCHHFYVWWAGEVGGLR